ncbi:hypothetical protein ACS78V_22310 [Yersinia enterocolitica]
MDGKEGPKLYFTTVLKEGKRSSLVDKALLADYLAFYPVVHLIRPFYQ